MVVVWGAEGVGRGAADGVLRRGAPVAVVAVWGAWCGVVRRGAGWECLSEKYMGF